MKNIFTTKKRLFTLVIILIIIGGIFSLKMLRDTKSNNDYRKIEQIININQNAGALALQSISTVEEITKSFYFIKNLTAQNREPKVGAEAYLVGDLNTGEVILAKNQDKKFPIASISKLMTALITDEMAKINDMAVASKKALATYGENGNFRIGEKIKTKDLVYPLLLESSNDAAEILAEYFGRDTFIKKMNREAQILNMSQTNFDDPSGLSEKNQSTVSDLFRLTGYLNQNKPNLLNITTKQSYSTKNHTWYNTSQFLHDDGYNGGKSGYIDKALQTDVVTFNLPLAKSSLRPIAITLLRSNDRYKDVESILKYLKKNVYYGGEKDANTDWVQAKIGVPEIADQGYVNLAFAGDIMLDRGVKNSVLKNFKGDYSALFEKLDILKKSDIVFANLEGPASDKGTDMHNLYSFRMDPSVIPAMKGAGISILSVASNHVGDFGRIAYIDTLSRLKENEILYTGGGMDNTEAENPTIVEKYGMKIGYLGFSDKGPDYMKADVGKAGLLLTNNPRFDEIIKNASKQVDYLIVSFHFGEEYQVKHNARQELLAHKAIDDGAKIIIGHHPHVIEDTEVYTPKSCTQSSCMGYIAYSLGNFIFDQAFSAATMQGMLLEIKLGKDGSMTVNKNTIKLNKVFQPYKVIIGKEEKIKFK